MAPAAPPSRVRPWHVLALVAGYCLLHALVRLAVSGNLGEDDQIEAIYAQELRLGYWPHHPPLYEWLLWSIERLTGPGLAAFLLLKYGAVVVAAGFLFLAARRILGSAAWALVAIESLALIYSLSWRLHEGFTHEVLALAAAAATLHFLLAATDHVAGGASPWATAACWAGLGAAIGCGISSSLWYWGVPLTLIGAAALQPALRLRLTFRGLALAGAVALVPIAPMAAWYLEDPFRLVLLVSSPPYEVDMPFPRKVLRGLVDAVRQPPLFLSPLAPLLPLLFPGYLKAAFDAVGRRTSGRDAPDLVCLVRDASLAALALLVVSALLAGIGGQPVLKIAPLFIATPIWLIAIAQRTPRAEASVRRFVAFALAVAVGAFVARMANLYLQEPFCNSCRWAIPYAGLARHLDGLGLSRSTLVVVDHELGGNLRSLMPSARIVGRRWPVFTPAARPHDGDTPAALIWSPAMDGDAAQYLGPVLGRPLPIAEAARVDVGWRHPFRPTGYRTSEWRVLIVPPVPAGSPLRLDETGEGGRPRP